MSWNFLRLRLSEDARVIAGENTPLLIHNVLPALHAFNKPRTTDRLALALPYMETIERREDGQVRTMGQALSEVRLFGGAEALEAFAEQEVIQRLTRTGMIRRLRVRAIEPEEVDGYVSYHRLRRAERHTTAGILRRERRHQRRAEQRGESRDGEAKARTHLRRRAEWERRIRAEHPTVFIPMTSSSTGGQRFSLFVEERSVSAPQEGGLNSYGLSGGAEDAQPFAVPRF